jgi:hypothetical protein
VAPSRTVVGTVTLTERTGGEDPHYRVAIGGEMFFNKDALEIGKINSGTLQAQLSSLQESGLQVCAEVYGWRIPVLSQFENIKSFSTCN